MCMVAHMKPLVVHHVRIPKDENLPLQHWAFDGSSPAQLKTSAKILSDEGSSRARACLRPEM